MKNSNENKDAYEFFLSDEHKPKDFVYPTSYSAFVTNKLLNIEPWDFFFDAEELEFCTFGLKQRYNDRTLVPFARRIDNDDFACFDGTDTSGDPRVIIIHDFASPGWENHGEFENFLEWLVFAKEQSKEWKSIGDQ